MPYPSLPSKSAERFLDARRAGEQVQSDDYVVLRDAEDFFYDGEAVSLHKALWDLKAKFPDAIGPKSKPASAFEAAAAPIVHTHLGNSQYCADPEFWIWLAVVHFLDLISWRYGANFAVANLGIGASNENFMFRLWLRAELVSDPAMPDRYELTKRGGSLDFWRSHLFRQSYANARPFARALLRFQYPNETDNARLGRDSIRDLAKRLARIKSNLFVACLAEEEALRLIEAEAHSMVGPG